MDDDNEMFVFKKRKTKKGKKKVKGLSGNDTSLYKF